MSSQRVDLLKEVLEQGIGADIVVETTNSGLRTGLRSYFSGLTQNQGPVCTIVPSGLKRHSVSVRFGKFSLPCIAQMQAASDESLTVARALVQEVARVHSVVVSLGESSDSWSITGPDFSIEVTVRDVRDHSSADAVSKTAKDVMVPLMAAMAELIGYEEADEDEGDVEGFITESSILRRERSSRNRLLCISIHGSKCVACGLAPAEAYGEAGNIIEVHHLEPLAVAGLPRVYDPRRDLVPLCPSCHRAVHTRRPVPYTVEELKAVLAHGGI